MSDQQILVRGEAEAVVPADLAAVTIVVQVADGDQADAFEKASAVATAVDVVLDERAAALGPRQSAVVVVQPTTRWVDGEEQRTGWQALRSSTVDVHDLGQLTPLLAELVGAGAIVVGPSWRLRPDHPVWDDVRRSAAADAQRRATAYATGLGLAVGRVEWIAEPGLRQAPAGGGFEGAPAQAMKSMGGGDATLPVEAADLVVSAAVEVGFGVER